jgi:hypothetical protein
VGIMSYSAKYFGVLRAISWCFEHQKT